MRRNARLAFAGALALLVGAAIASGGCSTETRYRVLSTVFDGVPAPGTPRPLRPVPAARIAESAKEPAPAPPAPVPPKPELSETDLDFDTYAALVAAFPKDLVGGPDWAAAARGGLINPRASTDPAAKPLPQFPLEVRLDPGIPNFEVVFPHAAHTYWLRCDNCHPQIFQMKAGSNPITMASIFQGEYCGRCHGKVAFAPATSCARCHVALAGGSR